MLCAADLYTWLASDRVLSCAFHSVGPRRSAAPPLAGTLVVDEPDEAAYERLNDYGYSSTGYVAPLGRTLGPPDMSRTACRRAFGVKKHCDP